MKRITALMLILSLLTMLCPVLAEDMAFTRDMVDASKSRDDQLIPDISGKLQNSDTAYDVTVDGSLHIIRTGKVNLYINLPNSFVGFTQDWKASLMMYVLFNVDQSLAEDLANANIHLLILDLVSSDEIHIKTMGGDKLCEMVGDLTDLPEKYYDTVGAVYAEAFSAEYTGIYKTASNVWIALDNDWLLTIVNGEYVVIEYNGETITDLETEAFHEIADALIVT